MTKLATFSLLCWIVFCALLPSDTKAQIKINEVYSGTSGDWVEVFNLGESTTSIELSQYIIRDSTETNKIKLEGVLNLGEFLSFGFSNKLNNNGDEVRLIDLSTGELVVDSVSYGVDKGICAPSETQSIGRQPDGLGNFVLFAIPSKDSSNVSSTIACPTSTPNSTPITSPKPTVSSISTSSPTPGVLATEDVEFIEHETQDILEVEATTSEDTKPESLTYYAWDKEKNLDKEVEIDDNGSGYYKIYIVVGVAVITLVIISVVWMLYRGYNDRTYS